MRHFDLFKNLTRLRVDSSQIAFVAFQSCVPKISINPGHPGYEAVRFDRSQDFAGVRVDLMDLPITILSDPQSSLGPGKPGVAAAAWRRNRGKHTPGFHVDLLNAILRDLKEVLAVECCSGMRSNIDRADCLPACWIDCIQFISGRKPDTLSVVSNSMHLVNAGKWTILVDDFRC